MKSENKSDINPEILAKIEKSDQLENVKKFLNEALQLEYDYMDYSKPRLKKKYSDMVRKYKD